jgi:hypothetical protein
MPRAKNSSRDIHIYLEVAALLALRAEAERLETRPGKLLSRIISERAASFYSEPIELLENNSLSVPVTKS